MKTSNSLFFFLLVALFSVPSFGQELSSSRRSGIYVNISPQYFYSRLEREEEGGSNNFSVLSPGGARVELDIWGFAFSNFSLHLKGEYNGLTFEGPTNRTFMDSETSTYLAGLRFQLHIMRDIKIFIQGNSQSVMVMSDESSTEHTFKPVAVTSALAGLWLTAESDVGFGLDVEIFAGAGAGEGELDTDPENPVSIGFTVGAKSRLSFGARKRSFQWGIQSTVFLAEHEQGMNKYVTSSAAGGLFMEGNF